MRPPTRDDTAETEPPFLLNEDKCTTCLFHPGRMRNGMREVVEHTRARNGYVACHETYTWGEFTPAAGVRTAMCRGYWDAYREGHEGLALLDQAGIMVEVPAPPPPADSRPHRFDGDVRDGVYSIRPTDPNM